MLSRHLTDPILKLFLFLLAGSIGHAQQVPWPAPNNLKILPKETTDMELRDIMRGFSDSLGVRCDFCHVGRPGADLSTYDFASDEKNHKKKARHMMEMTHAINQSYLPKLGGEASERIEVTCMTCHRKLAEPVSLQDTLARRIAEQGIDSAIDRYRKLKKQYHGGFSYDFSAGTLSDLATRLARDGKVEEARRIIALEREEHPDSHLPLMALATIELRSGNPRAAQESMEQALELAPPPIKRRIEQQLERLRRF